MKIYRLCRDSYVRKIADHGYITSQLTKHDRVYDSVGAVFLSTLTREPKSFETLLVEASAPFISAPLDQISSDLYDFLTDLESDGYIVSGETIEELDRKEPRFSYRMENPKTAVYNYLQNRDDLTFPDTSDVIGKFLRKNPMIFACQIELTNRCNERCIHCYIPHEAKTDLLPTETILDVLEQLHALGTLGLTVSGGEAFMHPDIEIILRKARELDFSINILSNLTLLKPEHIQLLKDVNPSLVQTSVYSMNAEEHDAITLYKGSHSKTMAALELLIANDIPVQISCPVMKTNLHSYKAVLEWAQAHRCKAQTDFIMMAKTDFTTDNLDQRLSLAETGELLNDILEVDIDYDSLLDTPQKEKTLEELKQEPICGVGVDNICLAANGTFYPCSGWQSYPVGNAQNQRISDIWNSSPELNNLRTVNKGSFEGCLVCADKDFCAMCLVRNFNESGGDMFKINDHFCKAANLNRVMVEEHLEKKRSACNG